MTWQLSTKFIQFNNLYFQNLRGNQGLQFLRVHACLGEFQPDLVHLPSGYKCLTYLYGLVLGGFMHLSWCHSSVAGFSFLVAISFPFSLTWKALTVTQTLHYKMWSKWWFDIVVKIETNSVFSLYQTLKDRHKINTEI